MARRKLKVQRISDEAVYETIIQMCAATGRDGTVRPEDVAIELYPMDWQSILKRVKLFAKQLAASGEIEILRKGEVANPDDVKGVIRLRIAAAFLENVTNDALDE